MKFIMLVCLPQIYQKIELCEEIKKIVLDFNFSEIGGSKDPDQRKYIVSNKKFENTGFETSWSLQLGIRELIKGYKMINNRIYGNI